MKGKEAIEILFEIEKCGQKGSHTFEYADTQLAILLRHDLIEIDQTSKHQITRITPTGQEMINQCKRIHAARTNKIAVLVKMVAAIKKLEDSTDRMIHLNNTLNQANISIGRH